NPVTGLQPQNFRLREDGARQSLAHFAPTRAPVRIVLLVEANPAVFLIRRDHLTAARHLLRALRPEDEVALISYSRSLHPEAAFTRDKRTLERTLDTLGRFGLGMAEMKLFDAVADTLAWLGPPVRRTAVLVIGTGLDTGSRTAWERLEKLASASQVTIFTLATGRLLRMEPDDKKSKKKRREETGRATAVDAAFARADERLRALARASAGTAYFPASAGELEGIYREIGERLRNLYSLGYYPADTTRDGRYRGITIELVDEKGEPLAHRVFARPGYFAPRD
ncbi:MAG: VWA domain-containing protein, partial [Terriglobia bacterium]